MVHHWRASDGLEPTPINGEWMLFDRSKLLGYIQYGKYGGLPAFRGVLKEGGMIQVLGYSPTLEQCCKDMYEWYVKFGTVQRR